MSLSPEQGQRISDLRQRMFQNIAEGKPSNDGLTREEIREALSFIRQNRTAPAVQGGKAKAAKNGKAKPDYSKVVLDAFADVDLD